MNSRSRTSSQHDQEHYAKRDKCWKADMIIKEVPEVTDNLVLIPNRWDCLIEENLRSIGNADQPFLDIVSQYEKLIERIDHLTGETGLPYGFVDTDEPQPEELCEVLTDEPPEEHSEKLPEGRTQQNAAARVTRLKKLVKSLKTRVENLARARMKEELEAMGKTVPFQREE